MLTQDKVLESIRGGRQAVCWDGRDFARLSCFFPLENLKDFGMGLKEGTDPTTLPPPTPWTEEAIKEQLKGDLEFAFEKALNKRGISASFMVAVVKMWMWVLEDELEQDDRYAQYGLPFLKAIALKYNLPNPIGDDEGDEDKYSERGDGV